MAHVVRPISGPSEGGRAGGVAGLGDRRDQLVDADQGRVVVDLDAGGGECTFAVATPSRRPTSFSIFATQDGQEKPSARRIVWVVVAVVALMVLVPSGRVSPLKGWHLRR